MPSGTWWETALKLIGLIGGAVTGGLALDRYVIKPASRHFNRALHAFRTAEFIATPDRINQVTNAINKIEQIAAELHPNGGKSLRDQLNRIERGLLIERSARRALAHSLDIGLMEADSQGEVLWSNRTFAEVTGLRDREAVGFGWLNAIDISERARVSQEWDDAIRRQRPFRMLVQLCHFETKVKATARLEAWPLLDSMNGETVGFFGVLALERSR